MKTEKAIISFSLGPIGPSHINTCKPHHFTHINTCLLIHANLPSV